MDITCEVTCELHSALSFGLKVRVHLHVIIRARHGKESPEEIKDKIVVCLMVLIN